MATLESLITLDDESTLNDLMKNIKPYLKTGASGTSGIFSKMTGDTAPAFLSSNGQLRTRLDHILKSRWGKRVLSPYVLSVYEDNKDEDATVEDFQNAISMDLQYVYAQKWQKLYETCNFTYDPIANVDGTSTTTETRNLTETHDITENHTGTDTDEHTGTDNISHEGTQTAERTGTDTITDTGTDTISHTGTDTDTDTKTGSDIVKEDTDVFGYNSDTATPSGTKTSTTTPGVVDTIKHEKATTDTDTKDLTNETTYNSANTRTDNLSDNRTVNLTDKNTKDLKDTRTGTIGNSGTVTTTITRKGNIGVTTTQQMIEAERKVWEWLLYDVILKDALDFLTIPCYLD